MIRQLQVAGTSPGRVLSARRFSVAGSGKRSWCAAAPGSTSSGFVMCSEAIQAGSALVNMAASAEVAMGTTPGRDGVVMHRWHREDAEYDRHGPEER